MIKKLQMKNNSFFPDNIHLFQDSGYQGFQPQNVFVVQPYKKPRNAELTPLKKWFNTLCR